MGEDFTLQPVCEEGESSEIRCENGHEPEVMVESDGGDGMVCPVCGLEMYGVPLDEIPPRDSGEPDGLVNRLRNALGWD